MRILIAREFDTTLFLDSESGRIWMDNPDRCMSMRISDDLFNALSNITKEN